MQDITTAISTVGFPIVMTLLLWYQMNKTNEAHKEEMNKVTEALNNNTLALQKLSDKMGVNSNE